MTHKIDVTKAFEGVQKAFKAWPVELEKAEIAITAYADAGESGAVGVSGGPQFGSAKDTGFKIDTKVLEHKFMEGPGSSLEPAIRLKGGWEVTGGKTELSASVEAVCLGGVVEGKLVLAGVAWDQKTLEGNDGQPKVSILNLKVGGGININPGKIDLGNGQKLTLDSKAMLTLTFRPNYIRILQTMLTRSLGASFVTLGAAAAGAIIGYTAMDASRVNALKFKLGNQANAIVRASANYGAAMVGTESAAAPTTGLAGKAWQRGIADRDALLARAGLTLGQYQAVVHHSGMKDAWASEASSSFAEKGLDDLRSKAGADLKAWHDEHYIQSFFAGRYLADDLAMVEAVISQARATGGHPTIG